MAPHRLSGSAPASDQIVERYLDHLAEAIRFRTVAEADPARRDLAAFDDFRRWVASTFPLVWQRGRAEVVGDHSLVFTIPGKDRDLVPVLLMGHIDVVPIDDGSEKSWTWPPFAGERSDTHLYGRGALDDKGSVVAILETVEDLLRSGEPLVRTLNLAFGHDEEASGRQGAAAIAGLFRSRDVRFSVVLDEGGFVTEGVVPATRRPVALVGVAEKGYLDVELAAHGDPGHSATPPPQSAIARLAAAVHALEQESMPARLSVQRPFFRAAAKAVPWYLRPVVSIALRLRSAAVRHLTAEPHGNALVRTTIAPTMISGGTKGNMMPGTARAIVNVRILPGDTTGDVLDHIKRVTGGRITVRPVDGFEPSPVSSHTGPGFTAISEVIGETHPDAVVAPWLVIGATDSRYFARLADEVFRFTPFRVDRGEVTGFHGTDERIRLSDGAHAVHFYRTLIQRLCGPSP